MRRLCTESSCPYSGRSVRPRDVLCDEQYNQIGHWLNKPRRIGPPSADVSESDGKSSRGHSAPGSNSRCDWAEVSSGHSNRGIWSDAGVKDQT